MESEDRSLTPDPQPGPEDQAQRFAREWEEIVAGLTSGPDPVLSPAPDPPMRATDESTSNAATGQTDPAASEGLARLFQPLRREVPEANAPDEEHFVPPVPPDLPVGTPLHRLAWAGTLGGPAILLGAALIGYDLPQVVYIAAGIAAIAGFTTLIWLLPDSREDSGWDDGAQV